MFWQHVLPSAHYVFLLHVPLFVRCAFSLPPFGCPAKPSPD
jgi:hypothetical protein